MLQFIAAHQTIIALVVYYIFGALVGGMPAPTATSSTGCKWAFSSLNILASNISRAASTTLEKSPNWTAALAKASGTPAPDPKQP